MKLSKPFIIGSRLAPCLAIGTGKETAYLSFDSGTFVLDFTDGTEHKIKSFNFPRGRIAGDTDEDVLQQGFAAVLSFLAACAESRKHAARHGGDPMSGENSDLFPASVGEWAESMSDEISGLACWIEESKGLIAP